MAKVLAAADIGSNTCHLLVAEVQDTGLKRLVNESEWLSLGEAVGRLGAIPEDLTDRLIETLRRFRRMSEMHQAGKLYVFATEAMRRAHNCEDVTARIKREAGVSIDLITARREAELSLAGVAMDCKPGERFVMVEVGGGSAQAALMQSGQMVSEHSLPLGTGLLTAMLGLAQPMNAHAAGRLEEHLLHELRALPPVEMATPLVASGGVARGLVRALHPDGERTLHTFELDYLLKACQSLTAQTISKRFNVKIRRAATLYIGAVIYRKFMEMVGVETMMVSEFGVREGAILEMSRNGAKR